MIFATRDGETRSCYIFHRIRKFLNMMGAYRGKSKVPIPYYVLRLHIKNAVNVDQLIGPFVPSRSYPDPVKFQVVVSSDTYEEGLKQCTSREVRGWPEPTWDDYFRVEFAKRPLKGDSLLVEVLSYPIDNRRCGSSEPGTHSGERVVGRAKIKVPLKKGDFGMRKYALVNVKNSEKTVEAFIFMNMELEEVWPHELEEVVRRPRRRSPTKQYRDH